MIKKYRKCYSQKGPLLEINTILCKEQAYDHAMADLEMVTEEWNKQWQHTCQVSSNSMNKNHLSRKPQLTPSSFLD